MRTCGTITLSAYYSHLMSLIYCSFMINGAYCSVAMPCGESDSLFMCICEPVYVYRFTGDTPDVVVVNKVAKEPMVG